MAGWLAGWLAGSQKLVLVVKGSNTTLGKWALHMHDWLLIEGKGFFWAYLASHQPGRSAPWDSSTLSLTHPLSPPSLASTGYSRTLAPEMLRIWAMLEP